LAASAVSLASSSAQAPSLTPEAFPAVTLPSARNQDAFALRSQLRAAAAQEAGRFADELIAVQVPQRFRWPAAARRRHR
jgi:hypothetical protein